MRAARQPDPTGNDPYYLTLLERDGNRGLLRMHTEGGNRGEASDAWATMGGDSGDLHAFSAPALTLSDGSATPVAVHEVSVVNGRARLVVSTSPTPKLFAQPGSSPGTLRVRVAGGRMPYTVSVGAAPGSSSVARGDDVVIVASEAVVSVRDATGASSAPVHLDASGAVPWVPALEGLAAFFTVGPSDPTAPRAPMAAYLDQVGNDNGACDVGDLRRWLNTHP